MKYVPDSGPNALSQRPVNRPWHDLHCRQEMILLCKPKAYKNAASTFINDINNEELHQTTTPYVDEVALKTVDNTMSFKTPEHTYNTT